MIFNCLKEEEVNFIYKVKAPISSQKRASWHYIGVTSVIEVIINRQISPPILLIVIIFSSDCGLLTGLELMEWFCGGKTVQKGHSEY